MKLKFPALKSIYFLFTLSCSGVTDVSLHSSRQSRDGADHPSVLQQKEFIPVSGTEVGNSRELSGTDIGNGREEGFQLVCAREPDSPEGGQLYRCRLEGELVSQLGWSVSGISSSQVRIVESGQGVDIHIEGDGAPGDDLSIMVRFEHEGRTLQIESRETSAKADSGSVEAEDQTGKAISGEKTESLCSGKWRVGPDALSFADAKAYCTALNAGLAAITADDLSSPDLTPLLSTGEAYRIMSWNGDSYLQEKNGMCLLLSDTTVYPGSCEDAVRPLCQCRND